MDSSHTLGKSARRATFRRILPQIRMAYLAAAARGTPQPVILAVDIREEKLQKLVSTTTELEQMSQRVEDSRQQNLLPIVLVDVASSDIARCLGANAKRAAAWLGRQAKEGYFNIAVLDGDGISWGSMRLAS